MFEFHNAINVHDDPNRHVVLGTPLDMEPGAVSYTHLTLPTNREV